MPKTIQIYPLNIGSTVLELKLNAKVLGIQNVQEEIKVIAEIDPTEEAVKTLNYEVVVTEQILDDDPGDYVTTLQFASGNTLCHVYETTRLQ